MKYPKPETHEPERIVITGDETWLAPIYESLPQSRKDNKINGLLMVRLKNSGALEFTGTISYTPSVSCHRCSAGIPWEIHSEVQTEFLPRPVNTPAKEQLLTQNDLDSYYLDEEEAADLFTLVNDALHLSLPTRLVPPTTAGGDCSVCLKTTQPEVYSTAPDDPTANSPFAALANWQKKH